MVIPFLPSLNWFSAWCRNSLAAPPPANSTPAGPPLSPSSPAGPSLSPSSLQAAANASRICGLSGKQFARGSIIGRDLTVPVLGGASSLKRPNANPILSEHGKWRREHLGAFLAAYGRTPFFIHLMPEIEAAYANSEGISLSEFNSRFLSIAADWIDFDVLRASTPTVERRRAELQAGINPLLSIFDALFRLGNDTAFLL